MAQESILIVEDEFATALAFRTQLEKVGYRVDKIVSTALEAIKLARERRPDLVLMDIKLVGPIDGIEAARQIRTDLDIPVVYVTAYCDDATLQRAKQTQPFGYVTKPVSEPQLQTTIDLALYNHAQARLSKAARSEHKRSKVFVSYSHVDVAYLERLRVHITPMVRAGFDIWDDSRLKPGTKWQEAIKSALSQSRVGVLLVSADFLASEFIHNNELPALLEAEERVGALILLVIVTPCRLPPCLARFQAVNSPSRTLAEMAPAENDRIWIVLCDLIEGALSPNVPGSDSDPASIEPS